MAYCSSLWSTFLFTLAHSCLFIVLQGLIQRCAYQKQKQTQALIRYSYAMSLRHRSSKAQTKILVVGPLSTLVYFGLLWYTFVCFGLLWSTLVYFGLLWFTLVYFGPLWSTLVHMGPLWSTLAQVGPLWSTWVHFGPLGCSLAHPNATNGV